LRQETADVNGKRTDGCRGLFAHGKVAMTAELNVRHFSPIAIKKMLTIRSWIEKFRPRFFVLKAEIMSGEILLA
jgi:acyl-CoA thioesterase FadM